MSRQLQNARNIAIILLLALGVAVLPGGGNAAETVLTAISMAFVAAIAFFGYRVYKQSQFTISTLADGRRFLLYSAIGAIVLMIVGTDELLDTGLGALLWVAVLAASVIAIVLVVREANSYT
ncbi:MAG: hypothetical protein ACR2N5_08565 [Solirubrobacterales bacterium]